MTGDDEESLELHSDAGETRRSPARDLAQAISFPGCAHPDRDSLAADREVVAALSGVAAGEKLTDAFSVDAAPEVLTTFGFTTDGERWQRQADMAAPLELATFDSPTLPTIDCIAMITVDRRRQDERGHLVGRNYVYDTLADTLKEFPADVIINVLIGNDNADYLSAETLTRRGFSSRDRARLRIIPASGQVSAVLRDHYTTGKTHGKPLDSERRGTWNYARALGGYKGRKGLLLIEDDIRWKTNGIQRFASAQRTVKLPIVSLFIDIKSVTKHDDQPSLRPKWRPYREAAGLRFERPVMADPYKFYCTQAMYFRAGLTRGASDYLLLHAHEYTYDYNLHRFMFLHGLQLGYIVPSLVQHTAEPHNSSVRSKWFPYASDFVEWMEPLEDS